MPNTHCGASLWRSPRGAIDMRLLVAALVCATSAGAATASDASTFCDAVVHGYYVEAVELSIRNGVDVDYPCRSQNGTTTALYGASWSGQTEIVTKLLSQGANATLAIYNGYSALYVAAQNNHSGVVSLLLAAADPLHSIRTPGWSPLHIAARRGSTEALEILLADGRLPINGRTQAGETPLYLAAQNGSAGALEALFRHGAFASIRNNDDWSPLYIAVKNDHGDVVRRLLEVVDPRRSTLKQSAWWGFSCLHLAAVEGSTAALEILLADGRLPIDSRNIVAPLWVAAEHGQLESVKILLGHGADAWSRAKLQSGWFSPAYTSAEIAAKNGHHEVAALIRTHQPWSTEVKLCATVACMLIAALIMSELREAARARERCQCKRCQKRWQEINLLVARVQCLWRRRASRRLVKEKREAAASAEAAAEYFWDALAKEDAEEPLGQEESKTEPPPEGYEIVARVLEHLGESHLLSTFEAQQIDDDALPFLEPSDLLDLGVAPMTVLAILGAAAASGKEKKLEAEDILHDVATHQSAIEEELREHRAEIERLKIQRREVPDEYCCPITCELMKEPVLCVEDGQTYERCAVERWWSRSEAKTSPSTGATLASTTLAPNYALKSLIASWKAQRSRARD